MKKIFLLAILIIVSVIVFIFIRNKTTCISNGNHAPDFSACCSGDASMGVGGLICAPKLPPGGAY